MFQTMEFISHMLVPYKETIGVVAGLMTILQFMSGSIICRDIIHNNSTENVSIMPFIGGLVVGILSLQYGFILQDMTTIYVNMANILFSIVYLWIYTKFLRPGIQKNNAIRFANIGGAITVACLSYAWFEEPTALEFRYGMLVTALLLLLIASPLFNVGQIIRTGDASSLPFPIILMGTIVTLLWLLYGLALQNDFIVAQNIAGFILSAIQLSLFAIYPEQSLIERQVKNDKKER